MKNDTKVVKDPHSEGVRNEFEKLAKPFVDFLYKYGTPHSVVIIDMEGAQFFHGEMGVPFDIRD